MKSRTKIWAELFRSLANENKPILMHLTTRNGAEFDFRLPSTDGIGDETFAPEFRFPFRYDEIVSVDLYDRTNPKSFTVGHDHERIKEIATETRGVKCVEILRITVPADPSD